MRNFEVIPKETLSDEEVADRILDHAEFMVMDVVRPAMSRDLTDRELSALRYTLQFLIGTTFAAPDENRRTLKDIQDLLEEGL